MFSCYRPVELDGPLPSRRLALARDDWKRDCSAHTDKGRAFDLYAKHYLATSGQLYYSDAHQLADYEDGYHRALDIALEAPHRATEMISGSTSRGTGSLTSWRTSLTTSVDIKWTSSTGRSG